MSVRLLEPTFLFPLITIIIRKINNFILIFFKTLTGSPKQTIKYNNRILINDNIRHQHQSPKGKYTYRWDSK